MTLRLTRLDGAWPIVTPDGRPTLQFLTLYNGAMGAIEAQEAAQDETIRRLRRFGSHTSPTSILRATENGSSVTIDVLAHSRIYADGTAVGIGAVPAAATGLLPNKTYACYYDDPTLSDTTPNFVFTTDIPTAQAAAADGRHWCGAILTPALSSGDTIDSGGAYPIGSSFGGELL